MKEKLFLLIICLLLSGCSKTNLNNIYKELENKKYSIERCYQIDEYKYNFNFNLTFLKNKEIKFEYIDNKCISDKCDILYENTIFTYLYNSENSKDTYKYILEEKNGDFKVILDNTENEYFKINDITFKYKNNRIRDFSKNTNNCAIIDYSDNNFEYEEIKNKNLSDYYKYATKIVELDLYKLSDLKVNPTLVKYNKKIDTYMVVGNVSYKNSYNNIIKKEFTVKFKVSSSGYYEESVTYDYENKRT